MDYNLETQKLIDQLGLTCAIEEAQHREKTWRYKGRWRIIVKILKYVKWKEQQHVDKVQY